jgi:hypothetical protein
VDVYLYQQFSSDGSSAYKATLYEGYPNDREVYYPWTPSKTVNPNTNLPYGDAIVGSNYQVGSLQTIFSIGKVAPVQPFWIRLYEC